MSLTDETLNSLLDECRAFCGITWTDEAGDEKMKTDIKSSAHRLEDIYGGTLTFDTDDTGDSGVNSLAHDLLIYRVFYIREKGLDDFEKNFNGQLLTLYRKGQVAQYVAKQAAESESESDA